jgi:hypothetical protein
MASVRFVGLGLRGLAAMGVFLLAACGTLQTPPEVPANGAELATSAWALASGAGARPGTWKHQEFPGKRASAYRSARLDGRDVVQVDAVSSASMLRNKVRVESTDFGHLQFSWRIPALITGADLTDRQQSDSPVRVVLAFEGDRSKFSARDGMLSELAHALTGEPMPYATLMYVWCNHSAPGTVLTNTRTSRIRKLVLESGPAKLNRWLDYERDVRADFIKVFGEEPGALVSIGIMTDTDNTETSTTAWYGPVRHVKTGAAP